MHNFVGTVLSSTQTQENNHIVTIFSTAGLIKFLAKGQYGALISPLTEAEFILNLKQKDLFFFQEGTIIEQHLKLRKNLENLQTAGKLVQALLKSQCYGKGTYELYNLFSKLLKTISEVDNPKELLSLFYVKILKHEGVLQLCESCSMCKQLPEYRFGGERFCKQHAPPFSLLLSPQDEKKLLEISTTRSLKKFLHQPANIGELVTILFNQTFE